MEIPREIDNNGDTKGDRQYWSRNKMAEQQTLRLGGLMHNNMPIRLVAQ